MKKKLIPIIGVALCIALAPAAQAQTINGDEPDNSMLYQANVNLTTLTQNPFTGVVGGIFYTPYFYNTSLNYVGYADPNDVPLVDSHTVTVWDSGGNVVAQGTVPSGTPTLWAGGYAWVPLSSTVTLSYENYYEVGATVVGGVDPWGDLISNNATDPGNNGQITWNVENGTWSGTANGPFVQAGSGYEFSRDGQYGNTQLPGTQTSVQDSIYPAPNIGYNIQPVPEPGSLGLAAAGATLAAGFRLMRKMKAAPAEKS